MLPPIPQGMVPVISQPELVRPPVDTPPVTPTTASDQDAAVSLSNRHPDEVAERLREEQRRRQQQQQRRSAAGQVDGEQEQTDEAGIEQPLRQGLWIDVEV